MRYIDEPMEKWSIKDIYFDPLFTAKESEMNDKPFLMNLTREVVIDYWKNITGREKESFSLMFRAAGMPLNF